MAIVTLEQAKAHLRVSHSDEDAQIQMCLDAAIDNAQQQLDATIFDTQTAYDASTLTQKIMVNPSIKSAILIILADLFEQRQETITGTIVASTKAVDALLFPYKFKGA